jgi:hypothetical protein
MDDVLIGLLLLIAGIGLTLAGLRVFLFLLPVWGFVAGFFVGAALIHAWFGDGFLTTVGGWIAGLILGVIFAIGSYLYWYVGAILAAASVGALLGSGLMALFDVDTAWVVFLVSLVGAALAAFAALVLMLPVYVVIINTAFAGAFAIVTSLLLLFNRIDLEALRFGGAWAAIDDSLLWLIVIAVLAGLGIAAQLPQVALVTLPVERWVRADAADRQARAEASDAESRRGI